MTSIRFVSMQARMEFPRVQKQHIELNEQTREFRGGKNIIVKIKF
jgi:hypothetical protein